MRLDVTRWWRVLAASIVAVLVVAIAIVIVQEPRVPSQASPPKPAAPNGSLPVAMAPPTAQPSSPPQTAQSPAVVSAVKTATHLSAGWGVDISWPQCGPLGMPAVQPGFAIVGINGGRPFTDNVCLAREVSYAKTRTGVSAYLNIDAPRSGDASTYGAKVALDGLARAQRAGLKLPVLWLDVEVLNHWSSSGAVNVAVINGALRALEQRGVTTGIYSSGPMWQQITGGAQLNVPVWLATAVTDYRQLPSYCDTGLGGKAADMTQYVAYDGRQLVDVDVLCQKAIPAVVSEFAAGRA
ncbi:MAG: hypothetical protein QOC57_2702 [Ilumatobacteraceae bacterium]|jgi:hypothetical protein